MTVRQLKSGEKIALFFAVNSLIFGGIFALKLIGLTTNWISLIMVTTASVEIAYFAIFIKMLVNKNSLSLEEMEKRIEDIQEDEEKTRTILIYIGHQMKGMQHELDILRKNHTLKPNGNAHHPKVQA